MSSEEKMQSSFIGKSILRANEKLAHRIAGLMFIVYNDAKRLTLSGYSFPSRAVVSQEACRFMSTLWWLLIVLYS